VSLNRSCIGHTFKERKIWKRLVISVKFNGIYLLLSFSGCSTSDDSTQTSRVSVRMTDAPGDYDAVYIDVQDVWIKSTLDNNDGDGWVSIGDVQPKIYNLLDLTGGVNVLLADNEVRPDF
jgi:hypothetical protein